MQAAVLGVSTDDVKSHKQFADKYHLPLPLLSDSAGETTEAYGALYPLGPLKFAKRQSPIVDPRRRIARIYRSVDA